MTSCRTTEEFRQMNVTRESMHTGNAGVSCCDSGEDASCSGFAPPSRSLITMVTF